MARADTVDIQGQRKKKQQHREERPFLELPVEPWIQNDMDDRSSVTIDPSVAERGVAIIDFVI